MDRGYVEFERLFLLHSVGAFFIIRAKSNTRYECYRRREMAPNRPSRKCTNRGVDKECGNDGPHGL